MPRRPATSARPPTESHSSSPPTSPSAEGESSSRPLSVASLTPNEETSLSENPKARANACPAYRHFRDIGGKKMLCKLCEERNPDRPVIIEINKYCSSTTVWRHLMKFHPREHNELKDIGTSRRGQPSVVNIFERAKSKRQYYLGRNLEDTKEELVRFICQANSPWNIVSKKYFLRLLRYIAQEDISFPSVKVVKAKAMQMYNEMKDGITHRFDAIDKVAITLDGWTSENRISFIGMTAHWIDIDWKMCECVLAIRQLKENHSGENMSEVVMQVLTEFNLTKKVCAITTDNASNNSTMIAALEVALKPVNLEFSRRRHVLCIAHVINLVMQAGLSALQVVDAEPEQVITEDGTNLTALNVPPEEEVPNNTSSSSLGAIVKRLRQIVNAIRSSTQREARYLELCKQLGMPNSRRLPLDCPTRWSSTFKMLQECLSKRNVIDLMALRVLKKAILVDEEWALVKEFVEILEPLDAGTSLACKTKVPTSNESLIIVKGLVRHLDLIMSGINDSSILPPGSNASSYQRRQFYKVCDAMKEKLGKYASLLTRNEALAIASLMDPSMKMSLIDNDFKPEVMASVRRLLHTSSSTTTCGQHNGAVRSSLTRQSFFADTLRELLPTVDFPRAIQYTEELDAYASSHVDIELEAMHWWRTKGQISFPNLSRVAKEFLCVQATSAAVERFFSEGRAVIHYRRSRLTAESVEVLLTLRAWYDNGDIKWAYDDDDDGDPVVPDI